jgi:hypothetical protein
MMKFTYELKPSSVDESLPLIYLWEIDDGAGGVSYRYVGKAVRGSDRPKTQYRRNVNNLLNGRPYRRNNPEGFRAVHRRLAGAVREGHKIRLTLVENVAVADIFDREAYWRDHYQADSIDDREGADSEEQRFAEVEILKAVSSRHGVELQPATRNGMAFDGFSVDPPYLVEVWAHQGSPKPAQKNKVLADALKLQFADRSIFDGRAAKILALASEDAARPFREGTWMAGALEALGIAIEVVALPESLVTRLTAVQRRQAKGNR